MRGKPLKLELTKEGCVIPTSHCLNADGYFRKKVPLLGLIMFHRAVWIRTYGEIPEGYEVDHLCKNRACCNIKHLRILEGTEHAIITNKERYSNRKAQAYSYWLETKCTGTALGQHFNVTFSAACRWVREWKV